jgi:hypothetical protein
MAEPFSLVELELRIALLPPISRGAHLAGPTLHAQRLVGLWGIADADSVPLIEAFRLLNAETVTGAVWRTAAARDYPGDPRHWTFPDLEDLLLELRELAWQAMLAGTLLTEGIKGVCGKRYRAVLPAELARLAPDWALSRLTRDGRDEFIDVRVRCPLAEPIKKAWREPISKAELRAAAEVIAETCGPGTRLSELEFWTKLKNQTGRPDLTRRDARTALDDYVPQLKIQSGYHRTK